MDKPCPRCRLQDWLPDDEPEGALLWFTCGGCGLQASRERKPAAGVTHIHEWFETPEGFAPGVH